MQAGLDEVRALVDALACPAGLTAEVTSVIHRSAWQLAPSGPSQDFATALAATLPGTPARRGFPYWMESALWEEAGIPTVVCGPAGGGLHAIDEWVDLAQLRAFPAAVADAVRRFRN